MKGINKILTSLLTIIVVMLAACTPTQPAQNATIAAIITDTPQSPTTTPSSTPRSTDTPSPTETRAPTETLIPTETPIPATATPLPQPILLRRKCGRDYTARAGIPIRLYYGGWGVTGQDLANQWMSALDVKLIIDGEIVMGEIQEPAAYLPYNCDETHEGLYWLYSIAILTGLPTGQHDITVTISALRALPDGSGLTYGPGELLTQTFIITVK